MEFAVKTSAWTSEIRNTSGHTQACSGQHQHFLELLFLQTCGNLLKSDFNLILFLIFDSHQLEQPLKLSYLFLLLLTHLLLFSFLLLLFFFDLFLAQCEVSGSEEAAIDVAIAGVAPKRSISETKPDFMVCGLVVFGHVTLHVS